MAGSTHSGTSFATEIGRDARVLGVACLNGAALTEFFAFEGELFSAGSFLLTARARVLRRVPAKSVVSRNV